ncbi:TIGR00730 family Rossman fold protein [Roseovarius sp. M141]|uniref:LOG family protein n=1 Tax=Roseovarius sp. M141 TaxID=2583806 RepID=UPI0020CF5B29|nr:TIGR00730 family Rossman fold protein [Roseovarius sp. M141]MCQ0093363.1 TIGR00730 family Rossman fold protein [Roseovarius sp. M141]
MRTPSICVFCGAREGARPAYGAAADELGTALAQDGWRLVYGAGDVGLMGRCARAAIAAGGATLGVIPQHLVGLEANAGADHVVTETMHERKKVMFMNSDAIVLLPGGAGSLDELFEVVTWRQLGLHDKPVVLIDVDGYWRHLIALLDHLVAEGFAGDDLTRAYMTVPDVPAALAALRTALPRRSDEAV